MKNELVIGDIKLSWDEVYPSTLPDEIIGVLGRGLGKTHTSFVYFMNSMGIEVEILEENE